MCVCMCVCVRHHYSELSHNFLMTLHSAGERDVALWYERSLMMRWCTKGCGMCYPVSGMMHIKTLAANR